MTRKPKNTDTFHFFNANPAGYRTGDCMNRAIALATGKSWETAVLVVALWEVKTKRIAGEGKYIDEMLQEFGKWQKHPMPKHEDGTRYTIRELAKELKREKNPVLVTCANHMTCIKGGKVWDTWDCGWKCVGNYWTLGE